MIKAGVLIDNRYEIQSVLGTGAFGYVYKAWHKLLARPVAVKVMNSVVMEESDGLARFEREARAMSALHHKNIVGFHGFGVWEGAPYMVMEFLQGTSLQKLLASKQPLHQSRALEVMIQLCEALASAHGAGIVHRDLKPSNLMLVDSNGRETLKVIDFGLAKMMPGYGIAAQRLTETGYAVGTCHYMSPEQCVGNSQVDHRTDIYAAGCILYEALVGEPPFGADDSVAVMFQHVNAPPPRLTASIRADAQVHALQAVIDKAMAKEIGERYQSAEEMLKDLRAIAIGNTRAHDLAQVAKATRPKGSAIYERRDYKRLVPAVLGFAAISAICSYALFMHDKHAVIADSPVLASTVYDELLRHTARNGRSGIRAQREKMVSLMQQALALNEHDHTLSQNQVYSMLHEQEWNLFALGKNDEGINVCHLAISMAPPNSPSELFIDYEHLERGHELKGQNAAAEKLLRRLASENWYGAGQRKRLNIALARLALKRSDYQEAQRLISQVPDVNIPGAAIGYYYEVVGDLAFMQEHYRKAQQAYETGLSSTGPGDEPVFQAGLARCNLTTKNTADYPRTRAALAALWQLEEGKFFLSLGLLNAAVAWELHDRKSLERIANEILVSDAKCGEMPALCYRDWQAFERAMTAAGYNQLLEKLRKKYDW